MDHPKVCTKLGVSSKSLNLKSAGGVAVAAVAVAGHDNSRGYNLISILFEPIKYE